MEYTFESVFKMNNKKTGNFFISFGLFIILCAGVLTAYNLKEDYMADIAAQNTVTAIIDTVSLSETEETSGLLVPEELIDPLKKMPEEIVDGVAYIGFIEIPRLNIYLPVASESSQAKLKLAPCRLYGTTYHNNLVIGAHNYRSHFGYLYTLSFGDYIYFTDMSGITTEYIVSDVEMLLPTQGDLLCSGDWPLSLYTCNFSGDKRLTIRCDKA